MSNLLAPHREIPATRPIAVRIFTILYALEAFVTASTTTVIAVQAYDLLQSEQNVSVLYTLVALLGLVAVLLIPATVGRLRRRWTYTAGVMLQLVGAACLVSGTLTGQIVGMVARMLGAGTIVTTLNLYVMDHLHRSEFSRVESHRLAVSTLAWILGPTFGVFLYARYGLVVAHATSATFAVVLLAVFWHFRLSNDPFIRPGLVRPLNPLSSVRRFFAQPRLRLAWTIAIGRTCFWKMLFVYGPILMITTGQGKLAGGMLVSAANTLLLSALYWHRLSARVGTQPLLTLGFSGMAAALLAAGYVGDEAHYVVAALLLVATFFCVPIDTLTVSVFMRSVHSYERAQMTSVYRTFPFVAELLASLVYSVVLIFFGLSGVFTILGLATVFFAWLTWFYLPASF